LGIIKKYKEFEFKLLSNIIVKSNNSKYRKIRMLQTLQNVTGVYNVDVPILTEYEKKLDERIQRILTKKNEEMYNRINYLDDEEQQTQEYIQEL